LFAADTLVRRGTLAEEPIANVVTAHFPAMGRDMDVPLTRATAAALRNAGMAFVVRYLSLGAAEAGDLSSAEVTTILGAGLVLMAVQPAREPNWMPSAELGSATERRPSPTQGMRSSSGPHHRV
jgi:hypothetical protein